MDLSLTAEQVELKRSARRFFGEHCASRRVRGAMETERGWDQDAWRAAVELGWPSLGAVGWVELALVMEEAGRSLACLPLFSSVCLGANALRAAGATSEWLAGVESGDVRATLLADGGVRAREVESGYVLAGEVERVMDGHTAQLLVVVAEAPEPSLFVVDASARGVSSHKTPALDPTRSLARVRLADVAVPRTARIGDAAAVRTTLARVAIALAAESVGGAERCLEMATDYAKGRVQFDRPIGSFQAIKHRLADMLVAVETARSAAYWAACVASSAGDPELPVAAALAKSYCTEAFFRCAADALQIHGGIGFTWEHDVHLLLRRARGSLSLLGSPARDRETVMAQVDAWT